MSPNPTSFAHRALRTLLAAALTVSGVVSIQAAVAEEDDNQSLDFAACVQAQGSGSVMVLMDESDTVYGTNGRPPADPRNLRVAGAQLLIDDIQRVVDATNSPVNVQLAGFGDNFVVRSSGWETIRPGDQGATASDLKQDVSAFAFRPTDGNQIETDFWSGIDGARTQFDSQAECKLLVLFKDGMDFQKFDAKNSGPFKLPDVQDLLDEAADRGSVTKAREAAALAQADMCRAKGLADGLRGDGIFTISVGLGEGDFADLQAFTENPTKSCGDLPGRGYLLRAETATDLINLFARTLDPSNLPAEFDGSFTFEMSPALSTISIVTSGMDAGGSYFITPPATCPGSTKTPFDSSAAQSSGSFGQGIAWNGAGYADGEALRIFINRANISDLNCWSGIWTVDPGTQARSSLSIEADLQPAIVIDGNRLSAQPGQTVNLQVLLRKISDPEAIGVQGFQGLTAEDLHPDLQVSLSGSVFNPQGVEFRELFAGRTLSAGDLGKFEEIPLPQDMPLGNYVIRLTLSLDVTGIEISLSDVRTETVVEVRGPIPLPTVAETIQFPEVLGRTPATTDVTFSNSAEKSVFLDLANARVTTSQAPENATDYRVTGPSDQVEIPAGESVTISLSLAPDTEEQVTFAGPVSGTLIVPVTAADELLPANFAVEAPFKADQYPDQNIFLLILFTILFLLIGTGLTALAIWLVSYRVSRFPKARKIQENVLQSITLPMVIDGGGLRLLQPLPDFASDQWQPIQVFNRRLIAAGFSQIKAKSPGLKFGRIGHAELADTSVVGWGMSGSGLEVDRKHYRPRLGLDLQQNFFVTIRPEDVPAPGGMDVQIPGQITFISSLNSFESNDDLVESARSSAMDVLDGLTQTVGVRNQGFAGQGAFGAPAQGFGGQPNDPFNPNTSYRSGNDPFM